MGVVELIIHSAQDLKDVKTIGTMQPYVVASIERTGLTYSENESAEKARTPPDKKGGCNPTWEHPLRLPFACRHLSDFKDAFLLLQIFASPSLLSSSPTRVGSTLIPFSHITCQLDPSTAQPLCITDTWQRSTSRIQRLSGRYQGFITFSVRIKVQEGPPNVSFLRKEFGESTNHIDPSSTPTNFPSYGQPYDLNSGDMAAAFVVGAMAANAWEMQGDW